VETNAFTAVFANAPFYGDGTSEMLFEKGLCFPSGSNLTMDELQLVKQEIQKCLSRVAV
jgi:dTDP-4-amino-4,6-dideoxygalactose transaminase